MEEAQIEYREGLTGLEPAHLQAFFEGWPSPPDAETHLALLRGSSHVVLAREAGSPRVVGFVTAISDGVLAAYVPLLEVLPGWRGRGIGSELVRRLLARLEDLYMVDLVCDPGLEGFYRRFGLVPAKAMIRRHFAAQSGRRVD
jgi:ribosomal protein S18 acetylase RimI-like enzyme